MSTEARTLIQNALALRPEERALVAEKILESLIEPDAANDAEWAREAEDRLEAYDRGEIQGSPLDEVVRDLRGARP
jgi:putative addiction module component (TIGR02574 family)